MEATQASHGVSGLVFLKLDILKSVSKEVFEVDNVITTKRTKKSAFTLFQTSSPLFYFSHFAKWRRIILGLDPKSFYQISEKENRCLVFTYPIKLKLGRFTSYTCSEFADN